MSNRDWLEHLADEAREILDELDPDERRVAQRILHQLFPDDIPPTDHLSER